jgi:hypothetical protein
MYKTTTGGLIMKDIKYELIACQTKKKKHWDFEWHSQKTCSKFEHLWRYIRKFEHFCL